MGEGVGIEVLKARWLAEAQELLVNEAIINGVELVDVVDDVFDLVLNKILYERVSAKGDTESDISLSGEGLVLNVGSEVCEGGVLSDDALGSGARGVSRNALYEDVDLGLIEFKTSILVKYMLKLGINLKTNAQLSMNIAVVGISKRAGEWMLFEDASPKMMNAEVEDRHLERITLLSARLALRCVDLAKPVIVA